MEEKQILTEDECKMFARNFLNILLGTIDGLPCGDSSKTSISLVITGLLLMIAGEKDIEANNHRNLDYIFSLAKLELEIVNPLTVMN